MPNTFGNQFKCNTNLDSNQHLNNGGEHLNKGGGLLNGGSITEISQGFHLYLITKEIYAKGNYLCPFDIVNLLS